MEIKDRRLDTPPRPGFMKLVHEGGEVRTLDANGNEVPLGGATADSVTTALAEATPAQAATIRDGIDIGDSFAGLSRLPLVVSRNWKEGRAAAARPPITVLLWGDSLTESINTFELFPHMRFNGWKLMRPDRASIVAGTAPTLTDGSWLHQVYRAVGASSTVEWTPPTGATGGVVANRVGVLYYKGASSANTFQLQYSQNNGSSWSNAGSAIDTSLAATNVAWFEFNLANVTNLYTRVRVVTTAGQTAKIIGCGAWYGDTENFAGLGGWVMAEAYMGGISPSIAATVANTTPTALSTPLAAMQVNMVLGSWADPASCWDTGAEFDDVKTAVDAGIVADWVFLTPGPMGPATSAIDPAYTNGDLALQIRAAMIAWAERQNQNVLDLYPRWRDWDTAKALGMMTSGDEIHPTDTGDRYKRWFIGEMMSRELARQTDAINIVGGPGGRHFQISAAEYAIFSELDPSNPASVLWQHTGDFGPTGILFAGTQLWLAPTQTPASAGATGVARQIAWDANYIYICVATNTWKRVAIATW